MTPHISLLAWCCSAAVLLTGCSKEVPDTAPPVNGYRTYDKVAVEVKADPAGGHVLLCKNTPVDSRTAFLQFLGSEGELLQRISFNQFPSAVENIEFEPDERWYTDFLPHPDGSFYVLGLARQTQAGERIHLIIHHIDRNGPIEAPFRRFVVAGGVMETESDGPRQDIDGLPRSKALGALVNNDLVVAVRWETNDSAGIRLYRFPTGNSTSPTLQADFGLPEATDRLHGLACNPDNGEVVLAFDSGLVGDDHRVRVQKFVPDNNGWDMGSAVVLEKPGNDMLNAEPQQLQKANGNYLLIGNQPQTDINVIKPFVTYFSDVAEMNGNLEVLDYLAAADQPVATYCANWWGGGLTLVTQVHEASALQPFFDGDITSDLVLTDLTWPDLQLVGSFTVIPRQGLRGIGLFSPNGPRLIIGSHHAYLNAAYIHTFRTIVP